VKRAPFIDFFFVLLFVVIGRKNHQHGESVAGVISTLWPFALGLAVGWLVLWRRGRTGASVADAGFLAGMTTLVGMVARVVAGQGTAVAFIIVTLLFLNLFFTGWRMLSRRVTRSS